MPDLHHPGNPDQAAGLRRLFGGRDAGLRIVALVTPEDGGDQQAFTVGLAAALARRDLRVLVLDGGEGKLAPALGLKARYNLRHLLAGDRPADAVAVTTDGGFRLLPAGQTLHETVRGQRPAAELNGWLTRLATDCDWLLACLPLESVEALATTSLDEFILVCGAEPWQLARAYARLKRLDERYPARGLRVAYCPAESPFHAEAAHERLARAAAIYLDRAIHYGGAALGGARSGRGHDLAWALADDSTRSATAAAFDQAATGLIARQAVPLATNPRGRPALASTSDLFSVVETSGDVYGPRHA